MNCTIKINMDNDSFSDPNELPRILTALANRIRSAGGTLPDKFPLTDSNGNRVGSITVKD